MLYTPTNWIDGETPVNGENLNKLEQAVRENSAAIQEISASAGSGVSSWNDLTDKPFGEESGEIALFPEQTLEFAFEGALGLHTMVPAPFALEEGETYRVVLDAAEHELVCTAVDGVQALEYYVLDENGEETDGSFVIEYRSPEIYGAEGGSVMVAVIDSTNTADHTLAICRYGTIVKTLDVKYLPMEDINANIDARIEAYIEEALGGDY